MNDLKYHVEKVVESFIDLCNEYDIDDRVGLVNIIRETLWKNRYATYDQIDCEEAVEEIQEIYGNNRL